MRIEKQKKTESQWIQPERLFLIISEINLFVKLNISMVKN
jgi:hypothetical protein